MYLVVARSSSLHWCIGVDKSDVNQKTKDNKNYTIDNIANDDEKEEKKVKEHVNLMALLVPYDFVHLKEIETSLQKSNVFVSLLCACFKKLCKCGCHYWNCCTMN